MRTPRALPATYGARAFRPTHVLRRYEYRNLVMQRIFEGRNEQELLSENMMQARFVQQREHGATPRGRT